MNKNRVVKYFAVAFSWFAVLALLNWFFTWRMSSSNGGLSNQSHFYYALTALVFKTIFIVLMVYYILPDFSIHRKLPVFLFKCLTCLVICFMSEQVIQAYLTFPNVHVHTSGLFANNPFRVLNFILYFLLLLLIITYFFTKEWVQNEKQKRELVENQLSTELKFLKAQLNPHFLFNTLNNLFSIAQKNNDTETASGISKLAGLMRYMLYDSSVTQISLEKEIKNMEDYIALSKLRYAKDEIKTELKIQGHLEAVSIAPMILLPFVENAFKHGASIEKSITIFISLIATEEKIIFTCINPINKLENMKPENYRGIGLENVKRRLLLLYPYRHHLEISESTERFTVKLEIKI